MFPRGSVTIWSNCDGEEPFFFLNLQSWQVDAVENHTDCLEPPGLERVIVGRGTQKDSGMALKSGGL